MIVFAVESGEYSDYRVDRLFTTRDLAEKYIAQHQVVRGGWYDGEVVEREVEDTCPDAVEIWTTVINGDNNIATVMTYEWADEARYDHTKAVVRPGGGVYSRGRGKTPEESRKAAQDKVAFLAAHKEGLA